MQQKYTVILGCSGSGKTLLSKAVKILPNTAYVGEAILPPYIAHIVNQPLDNNIYNALASGLKKNVDTYVYKGETQARLRTLTEWLRGDLTLKSLLEFLKNRKMLVNHIVCESNFFSLAPEFVYNSLPNCQIVYLYRDGRDCADGLYRSYNILNDEKLKCLDTWETILARKYDDYYIPWWIKTGEEPKFISSTPYVRAIWMWKEMIRRCNDFFFQPHVLESGRVMQLKYEDLVKDPVKYGTAVIEHLGFSMNRPLNKRFKRIKADSIGIYRRNNPEEIIAAQDIAKSELELHGYLNN